MAKTLKGHHLTKVIHKAGISFCVHCDITREKFDREKGVCKRPEIPPPVSGWVEFKPPPPKFSKRKCCSLVRKHAHGKSGLILWL